MILYIPRRERSLWVGTVREGIMVEVGKIGCLQKGQKGVANFQGELSLEGWVMTPPSGF